MYSLSSLPLDRGNESQLDQPLLDPLTYDRRISKSLIPSRLMKPQIIILFWLSLLWVTLFRQTERRVPRGRESFFPLIDGLSSVYSWVRSGCRLVYLLTWKLPLLVFPLAGQNQSSFLASKALEEVAGLPSGVVLRPESRCIGKKKYV